MFRSIATVFILAHAVQATFALIDYPRETVILKFTDEDLIQPSPVSKYEIFPLNAKRCSFNENKVAYKYLDTRYVDIFVICILRVTIEEGFSAVNSLLLAILGKFSVKFNLNLRLFATTSSSILFALATFVMRCIIIRVGLLKRWMIKL